jgi:hypothetical protein
MFYCDVTAFAVKPKCDQTDTYVISYINVCEEFINCINVTIVMYNYIKYITFEHIIMDVTYNAIALKKRTFI